MTSAWKVKIAIAAALLLVCGVGTVFLLRGNVRDWINGNYSKSASATKQANASSANNSGRDAVVYTSSKRPSDVAKEISDKWKPGDRHNTPSGYFLRYDKDMVAVTPASSGKGSRITVDDEARGYARWYPYVGGWWGTYSGPSESFRGGGPGAGK